MKFYDFGAGLVIALFLLIGANMADKTTGAFKGEVNKTTANAMNSAGQYTHDTLNGAIAKLKAR